jgi:putative ABC transport system permease protein
MNEASRLRARSLLRRHWRATIGLGILVGASGAVPMVGWEVARRTEAAFPGFVARSNAPDATVLACPAGYDPPEATTNDATEEFFDVCVRNLDRDLAAPLLDVPGISDIAAGTFIIGELETDAGSEMIGLTLGYDVTSRPQYGNGVLLHGRLLDQSAPDEVVVDEFVWNKRPPGMEIGSRFAFTPLTATQADCAAGAPCDPAGNPVSITVVGVNRTPHDLATRIDNEGDIFVSAGFWETQDEKLFSYGSGYDVWLDDGATSATLQQSLRTAFPDRHVFVESANTEPVDTLIDAIAYQSGAAYAFAFLSAIAALVFAGQALARQTRREGSDASLLTALGMRRDEVALATFLRALPIALIGGFVALVVAVVASPIGPVGIARGTIAAPSIDVDPLVVAVGVLTIACCSIVCSTAPSVRRVPPGRAAHTVQSRLRIGGTRLPAPMLAGIRALLPRRGEATLPITVGLAGTAVAIASVVAAGTLVASLDRVTADPANYGVSWDVLAGNLGSPDDEAAAIRRLDGIDGIEAASGLMSVNVAVGDIETPLIALVPAPGYEAIEPVIADGRAAYQPNEAVLGAVTMRELGVAIGDEIEFQPLDVPLPPISATVVGTALFSDGDEAEVGEGILIDGAWARSQAPGSNSAAIAIRLDPDQKDAALAELGGRFNDFLVLPVPSSSVRHLVRVDDLPILLAGVVVVLAAASLMHAMWVAVRQRRFELGVLKSLGFSRGQVWTSIATQATVVAGLAFAVGLPLGLVGGGWGWRAIAEAVGLRVDPVFRPTLVLACACATLVVALLAAVIPGWVAARLRPARALRAE